MKKQPPGDLRSYRKGAGAHYPEKRGSGLIPPLTATEWDVTGR